MQQNRSITSIWYKKKLLLTYFFNYEAKCMTYSSVIFVVNLEGRWKRTVCILVLQIKKKCVGAEEEEMMSLYTVKSQIIVRYQFSYFWLETVRANKFLYFWGPQNRITSKFKGLKANRTFHTVLNFVLFSKVRKYENKYRTKICDFAVLSGRIHSTLIYSVSWWFFFLKEKERSETKKGMKRKERRKALWVRQRENFERKSRTARFGPATVTPRKKKSHGW